MADNYERTRNEMRSEFLKYDQSAMLRKLPLEADEDYIYLSYLGMPCRVGRRTGIVELKREEYEEADFSLSMTVYDLLCYAKEGCCLSGRFVPHTGLKVQGSGVNVNAGFFKNDNSALQGKGEALRRVLSELGELTELSADVAAILHPFPFLPLMVQFWDGDEEFPPTLKFMFDENILDYMHFETTFYFLGSIRSEIRKRL
ncbi:MAG: DUF3786 domain-containing protein [Clostridiales bacterium]|nr:DUF3786 domain-containing protein [Candidatus Apopatocola equi]